MLGEGGGGVDLVRMSDIVNWEGIMAILRFYAKRLPVATLIVESIAIQPLTYCH